MKNMITAKKVQLTQVGFDSLQNELNELNNVKRPALVARLARARDEGDLSENADYSNAKEELEFLDGRIAELEQVLQSANIISDKRNGSTSVKVGTKVTVNVGGNEHIFEVVGEWEADPMKKKISPESPLGQALIGRKVGDSVEVEAPAGKVQYQILEIA
jgi:transcription elongation factor GreA